MSNLGARIHLVRKKNKNMTQQQLVNEINKLCHTNITRCMLSNWETGKQVPAISTISALSKILDVTTDFLINGTDTVIQSNLIKLIPVIGKSFEIKNATDIRYSKEFVSVAANTDVDFCIKVFNDNMANFNICQGDYVYAKLQGALQDGDIAVLIIKNRVALKRYYKNKNCIILADGGSKPILLSDDNTEGIKILAKAINIIRNL